MTRRRQLRDAWRSYRRWARARRSMMRAVRTWRTTEQVMAPASRALSERLMETGQRLHRAFVSAGIVDDLQRRAR